jgi:hypothetical protein
MYEFIKRINLKIPIFDPFSKKKLGWDIFVLFALIILMFSYLI